MTFLKKKAEDYARRPLITSHHAIDTNYTYNEVASRSRNVANHYKDFPQRISQNPLKKPQKYIFDNKMSI